MDMVKRPRRLRGNQIVRRMMRETRMDKASLIYPMFVVEGTGIRSEIPSMPGQYHYSPDLLPAALEEVKDAGVSAVMLFGIPDRKDELGSAAWATYRHDVAHFERVGRNIHHVAVYADVAVRHQLAGSGARRSDAQ